MIKVTIKGDGSKTNKFLEKALNVIKLGELDKYGREGVQALSASTPKDSGKTAECWYYKIIRSGDTTKIEWLNSNTNEGIPIVILIQYGHASKSGVYVQGIDFINPSMKSVFNTMRDEIWKELISNE